MSCSERALPQAPGLQHHYIRRETLGKVPHCHGVGVYGNNSAFLILLEKPHFISKNLYNIPYHSPFHPELYPKVFTGIHIRVLPHINRHIQTLSISAFQALKGPARLVQNLQVLNAVHTVIGNRIETIMITDDIIFPFPCCHLIRGNHILPRRAILPASPVQGLIGTVLHIVKPDLLSRADRFVQQFNI